MGGLLLEPKRVDQTYFSGDATRGNCLQACVATLFGLALNDVPDLRPKIEGPPVQATTLRTWLHEYGWTFARLQTSRVFDGYYIASGPVERITDVLHAVVLLNGALYHDPHPSRAGILTQTAVTIFYPLQPRLEV